MNKTLALIAALGLVVSAPAFAADEDTAAPAVKAEVSKDIKADAKDAKTAAKDKTAAKEVKGAKIAVKDAKDAKDPKAAAASDLAPSAGAPKTDTKN